LGASLATIAAFFLFSCPVNGAELSDVLAAFAKQDNADAIAKLEKAAEDGNAQAQAILGTMYYDGLGVPYDKEKAFPLNMKAAQQGRLDAQFRVAMAYSMPESTYGRPKIPEWNVAEASKWFNKAAAGAVPQAEGGDPIAQYVLGELYHIGRGGIASDQNKAFSLLLKAAEQNVPDAQYTIAYLYEHGHNEQGRFVTEDKQKAREWYTKAAQAGLAGAQLSLGRMLELSGDKEGAKLWYTSAALLGDPIASGFLKDHYNIHLGDPTAFDQQQADLRGKEAVWETDRLINFGGVALGNAVISLMGTGGGSVDDAALKNYREQIQRNTNNLTDQIIKNMHERDLINRKSMGIGSSGHFQ
jgi:TPR repeat protein